MIAPRYYSLVITNEIIANYSWSMRRARIRRRRPRSLAESIWRPEHLGKHPSVQKIDREVIIGRSNPQKSVRVFGGIPGLKLGPLQAHRAWIHPINGRKRAGSSASPRRRLKNLPSKEYMVKQITYFSDLPGSESKIASNHYRSNESIAKNAEKFSDRKWLFYPTAELHSQFQSF